LKSLKSNALVVTGSTSQSSPTPIPHLHHFS
jgi:hypothetical protein